MFCTSVEKLFFLVFVSGEKRMHLDEVFLQRVLPDAQVLQGTLNYDVTFSLDSRTIQKGQCFVPVRGEKSDGHTFLEVALSNASGTFIARSFESMVPALKKTFPTKFFILVDSPEGALFKLAAAWRAQFSIPIIGVTGSVGKTSTKLLIANILKAAGKNCFQSSGNQNTLFGVSLNIAHLQSNHDVAVFEVGISKRGEMGRIVECLQPTTAVITCIGHSHMEGLGSLHDIAVEKRDIFKFFKEDNVGILNGDQSLLTSIGYSYPIIKFGLKTTNQVQARKVKVVGDHVSYTLKIYGKRYNVTMPGNHQEYINNILAAVTVAHYLGVDHRIIIEEIQKQLVCERRFQSRQLKGYKGILIDDAYNASPESVKAALLALQRFTTSGKKILVLGDMLELGGTSPFWHRQIGRFLRKVPSLHHLILVGNQVQWIQKTAPVGLSVELVPSWLDAVERLRGSLGDESVVLVKGSNGMHLSNLVNEFADKTSNSGV